MTPDLQLLDLDELYHQPVPPAPFSCPQCLFEGPDYCALCDNEGVVTEARYTAWMAAHPEAGREPETGRRWDYLALALACLAALVTLPACGAALMAMLKGGR